MEEVDGSCYATDPLCLYGSGYLFYKGSRSVLPRKLRWKSLLLPWKKNPRRWLKLPLLTWKYYKWNYMFFHGSRIHFRGSFHLLPRKRQQCVSSEYILLYFV